MEAWPIISSIALATIFAILLSLLSGFFSAAETGITAASRARLHSLEKDGSKAAKMVNHLLERRDRTIGALLLGNNLLNTLAAAITTSLLAGPLGDFGVAVATAVTTIVVLVFAEVLPKTYAIAFPERIALIVARPARWIVDLLAPLVASVHWVVRLTLNLFGLKAAADADYLSTRAEIRGTVDLGHEEGSVQKDDRDRIKGALDLHDLTIGDVMIHRKNIRMIAIDLPPREIVLQALSASHTRIPLFRDEPDNVVGVLHVKDLLREIARSGGAFEHIEMANVVREPWFVPETTGLNEQLQEFLRKRNHFALVVDEYGALMGLVTLEDILEEIVGDIRDEHDVVIQGVRPQPDGAVNVDGWVPIRDLNRAMDWNLPDEEAVTIAGLVIHEAQAIPEPGQRFSFHGYRFQVLRKNRNQILALRIESQAELNKARVDDEAVEKGPDAAKHGN